MKTSEQKADFVNCHVQWGEASTGFISMNDLSAMDDNEVSVSLIADCVEEEEKVSMNQQQFNRFRNAAGIQHAGGHLIERSVLREFGFVKSADEGC